MRNWIEKQETRGTLDPMEVPLCGPFSQHRTEEALTSAPQTRLGAPPTCPLSIQSQGDSEKGPWPLWTEK